MQRAYLEHVHAEDSADNYESTWLEWNWNIYAHALHMYACFPFNSTDKQRHGTFLVFKNSTNMATEKQFVEQAV